MNSLPLKENAIAIPALGIKAASGAATVSFHIPFLHIPVRPAANQRQETRRQGHQVSPWRQIEVEVYLAPHPFLTSTLLFPIHQYHPTIIYISQGQ